MKNWLLSLFILIASSYAQAEKKGFDIQLDISVEGQKLSSPRIQVMEGTTATFTERVNKEKTFFDVTATEEKKVDGKTSILMKFAIGKIDENGKKQVVSKPQILAFEDQATLLTQNGENGNENLSISITAKRKNFSN